MTYLPDIILSNTDDPLKLLPGMPCGPDIIDTSRMRAILPGLIWQVFMMVKPGFIERGARARFQEARRLFLSVYRAEICNLKTWLLKALKVDANWRRTVCEDLGGEAALARWERRYAKMMAEEGPQESSAWQSVKPDPLEASKRRKKKARTDDYHIFRLAKISKTAWPSYTNLRPAYPPLGRPALYVGWPPPIPLTPDQLRGPVIEAPSYGEKSFTQDDPGSAPDNAPRLTGEAIWQAWRKLHYAYVMFSLKVTKVDLALYFPKIERDAIPI